VFSTHSLALDTGNPQRVHPCNFPNSIDLRNPTAPSLRYPRSMRATIADGAFEFRVLERHGFDTTGRANSNPDLVCASVDEAKEWVEQHCAEVLKVPGHLHWTVKRGRTVVVIRATLFRRIGRAHGTA
jgi:hypothetical protein